jgi:hypothetical protein
VILLDRKHIHAIVVAAATALAFHASVASAEEPADAPPAGAGTTAATEQVERLHARRV